MIELRNVTKSYLTKKGRHFVYKNVTTIFPEGKNVGIIGLNGAGKSTLLRLIGKIEYPDSGEIITNKSVSWPVAFSGGFQGSLTALEIVKFVCMIYGVNGKDIKDKIAFIKDFTELGSYFELPIKTYSAGMKARLAFALSMAFDFDYYLIDEVTAVGDLNFRKKCKKVLKQKLKKSNVIIASHNIETLKFCDIFAIPYEGNLIIFDKFKEAAQFYVDISKKTAITPFV